MIIEILWDLILLRLLLKSLLLLICFSMIYVLLSIGRLLGWLLLLLGGTLLLLMVYWYLIWIWCFLCSWGLFCRSIKFVIFYIRSTFWLITALDRFRWDTFFMIILLINIIITGRFKIFVRITRVKFNFFTTRFQIWWRR